MRSRRAARQALANGVDGSKQGPVTTIGFSVVAFHGPVAVGPPRGQEAQTAQSDQPYTRPPKRLTAVSALRTARVAPFLTSPSAPNTGCVARLRPPKLR